MSRVQRSASLNRLAQNDQGATSAPRLSPVREDGDDQGQNPSRAVTVHEDADLEGNEHQAGQGQQNQQLQQSQSPAITPVEKAALQASGPGSQDDFYRQLGEFASKIAPDYNNLVFDAEAVLHVLQGSQLAIVPAQFLVTDSKLARTPRKEVEEIIASCIQSDNKIDDIIELCKGLVHGTVSVDRFRNVLTSELCVLPTECYRSELNPFVKPQFQGASFGTFDVQMVSTEASDLLARGQTSKFYDFEHNYIVVSNLFDAGIEILRQLSLTFIPQRQLISLALIGMNVWQQISVMSGRLVQIVQFGSELEATRKLAQLKYKRKSNALLMSKDARDIEDKAAAIAAKQVAERLKSAPQSFRGNFRGNGRFRGRGRWQNFDNFRGRGRFQNSYSNPPSNFSQAPQQRPSPEQQQPQQQRR